MSDAFFEKVFGDDAPKHVGSGWISGVLSIFCGMLGFGGTLCLHFPALLTLPDARAHYPIAVIRILIQAVIVAAVAFGAISAFLRQRKVLAMTGVSLALTAAILGGGAAPMPDEVSSKFGLGLDWFLLDLLVMTIVFVPLERFWPRHPQQGIFRPEWSTDYFYFVVTHLPAQLITFAMLLPATVATKWLAMPTMTNSVGTLPFILQLPLAILVADLAQYATHRAFHQIPFLWRFHSIHHSIKTMDWIAGSRSHIVDILVTRGLILIPMTLCGFSQATMAGYLVFVSFHATFCHTDFRPRTRWLDPYIVTVRYHHWHHAADKNAIDVNFAIHLPFIDKLFGTHYLPQDAWPERYGLLHDGVPKGFFRQLIAPFMPRRARA